MSVSASSDTRVALVTGGSRGIGRAIALRLAADGCRVALSYAASEDAATEVVNSIAECGGEAAAFHADLAQAGSARALFAAALERFGQVDILINNAGMSSNSALIAETPEALWRDMFDLNLNAVFYMLQQAIPHMRERGGGHIVNLSSNVTRRMPPNFGAYAISKYAVEALTQITAKEEGARGIRVNAIAPGPIMTDMLAGLLDNMGPERAQAFVDSVPLGRTGTPEEIAGMVAMLVSDVASYVTGQIIYVNGGGPGG